MRLVLAIVSFVLAAVMLASGILFRTVLAPATSVDLAVTTSTSAPLTLIDGSTLLAYEGRQTLDISGAATVTAAYGRSSDVRAWIGDASYNLITFDATTGELVSTLHSGTETTVPSLVGSDLWYDDYQDDNRLSVNLTLPAGDAVVIASDGSLPAPTSVAVSWPFVPKTFWDEVRVYGPGPLIIAGCVLLVFGLVMLLVAVYRLRGDHGPRRKMPKLPRQKTIKSVRPATRTPAKGGTITGLVLLLAVVAMAVPTATPARAADEPSPTPTGSADDTTGPVPAVSTIQLDRIYDRVVSTIAQADSALDADLLATRMAGPALRLKTADYQLLAKDATATAQAPTIPADGELALRLPQQVPADAPAWPRTVMVVVTAPDPVTTATPEPTADATEASPSPATTSAAPTEAATPTADATGTADAATTATASPIVLVLQQDTPRDNYKVEYELALQAPVPEVAAASVGAALLAPDTTLLSMSPQQVATGYADLLAKDTESEYASEFDVSADSLAKAWGLTAQLAEQQAQQQLESPNKVAYATVAGTGDIIALATTDAGALVAATIDQTMTVTPGEKGAKVIAQGDVLTMSGVERSGKGYTVTYGGQVLFFVPALDSDEPIVAIAYAQGLVAAGELQ